MSTRNKTQSGSELRKVKLKKPGRQAGGVEAVTVAGLHLLKEMGPGKMLKVMGDINQMGGFDCPGCAWPDPDDKRSGLGEFCENGAKAIAEEATNKKIGREFFRKYSVQQLSEMSDRRIGKSGRLVEPMIIEEGETHYKPITWNDAFNRIGGQLKGLDSPDEAIFYTSGRTSNEAAFMYQLFVRVYGTNNLPDCSNMCHESSGAALKETLGIGKGSVTLNDFDHTELIIIIGQNPGSNHPRMLTALQSAKRKGAKIITINPLAEAGLIGFRHPQHPFDLIGSPTTITDLFLQVRINQDVALLKAILRIMLDREDRGEKVFDHDFIQLSTSGFEEFVEDLRARDPDDLIALSGVDREEVLKAVDLICARERIIVCWAMGLTQHKNAIDNIREIVNLLLLKGSIGKKGAGTCPVRGHSNVQGDRTVGIVEKPAEAFLDNLEKVFGFKPPRKHGFSTVEAIQAMYEGKAKVFIGLGGNFFSATPDTEFTAQALQNCEMTVQVSTKLNRGHLIHGKTALILPCLARSERDEKRGARQFVSVENSTGIVHRSEGKMDPASDTLLSEPQIVAGIAEATLEPVKSIPWHEWASDYDLIRDSIESTLPGFENYNERVRQPAGFYLPNGARIGDFKTNTGKANFTINKLTDIETKEGEYVMMTIRSHDQFNTTIYGLDDRYRGVYNERRVIFMNEYDVRKAGLKKLQVVDLRSNYEGVARIAKKFLVVPYKIPSGCVATYFPEANPLVPVNYFARKSLTPASKSVIITIRPSN